VAGKARASQNALGHGLATITRDNPAFSARIEAIARALCPDASNPLLFDQALIIAETTFVLRCVRTERIARIERLRDGTASPLTRDMSKERAKARWQQAQLLYDSLVRAKADSNTNTNAKSSTDPQADSVKKPITNAKPDAGTKANNDTNAANGSIEAERTPVWQPKPIPPRDELDAMCLSMPDLNRLERYEQRTLSRRKRAIQTFIEISNKQPLAGISGTAALTQLLIET
jgi:hypothetical protein